MPQICSALPKRGAYCRSLCNVCGGQYRRLIMRFVLATLAACLLPIVAGCTSSAGTTHPRPADVSVPSTLGSKQLSYRGVQMTIPAAWPVIDGAHALFTCSSVFAGQSDRAFLGASYRGTPSCPMVTKVPPADGVWMQPGGRTPQGRARTLPAGQHVYFSDSPRQLAVTVWYHRVLIRVGVGPNPSIERAILASLRYNRTERDTAVRGRCPAPNPRPLAMPTPTRVTALEAVDGHNGHLRPAPANVGPEVSAAAVWQRFLHDTGNGVPGAIHWSITYGRYSAATPARRSRDGGWTPIYRDVPTWLIQGKGIPTHYGSCGITVIAPYNADTAHSMGLTTTG